MCVVLLLWAHVEILECVCVICDGVALGMCILLCDQAQASLAGAGFLHAAPSGYRPAPCVNAQNV